MKPVIVAPPLLEQAALQRPPFFALEKGWVPANDQGLELDSHDAQALHFGVEQDGRLMACMRALRGDSPRN